MVGPGQCCTRLPAQMRESCRNWRLRNARLTGIAGPLFRWDIVYNTPRLNVHIKSDTCHKPQSTYSSVHLNFEFAFVFLEGYPASLQMSCKKNDYPPCSPWPCPAVHLGGRLLSVQSISIQPLGVTSQVLVTNHTTTTLLTLPPS